ncbi:MAG: hypothetical protein LBR90_00395, partial [Elusimicrobiota bacterium]|nr:hypothetical protein [Elusimicrobiota bacterium]
MSLYPKISLGGAYAGSSFKRFAAQVPYKSGAAQLEAPLYVLLPNNFYLESNYFIRADYNKNLREDSFYTSNFSKANITFKNDLLTFKAGRQSYTPQGKEFVIYYGDGILRDNAAPTALDAITHTLATRYFAYDLLLGREVKKLSLNNDDSLVYGGNVMFSLGEAFSVDAFYYGRQTEYTIWSALISDDFTHHNRHFGIYGGGINIKIAGQTQFSLYAAKNSGAYKVNMPMLEIESRYSRY